MLHEFFTMVRDFPFGFFLLAIFFIWSFKRVLEVFINRNKHDVYCDCDEDCNEVEVIASSGEEEDDFK